MSDGSPKGHEGQAMDSGPKNRGVAYRSSVEGNGAVFEGRSMSCNTEEIRDSAACHWGLTWRSDGGQTVKGRPARSQLVEENHMHTSSKLQR